MSVLIAYGSSHGSTKEIAERIAERIKLIVPPEKVILQDMKDAPKEPDAAALVVGSAIHAGRWLSSSRKYLHSLKAPPNVWAFSVGMMDGADKDREEAEVEKQIRAVVPDLRAHKQFRGRFVASEVNWALRLMLNFVSEDKFPRGDRRDWADIEGWADEVAKELKHLVVHTAP